MAGLLLTKLCRSMMNMEAIMRSLSLAGAILVVTTSTGLSTAQAQPAPGPPTAWSASGVGCVPTKQSGLQVNAGAVTAGAGVTATLYCNLTTPPTGAFNNIDITYKGAANSVQRVFITAELIEMSKETGLETVNCGVQSAGAAAIKTDFKQCRNSELRFNENFYYVRIVLKSGNVIGQLQTLYGTSLTVR
jgi:hypothetical protein